MRSKDRHFTNSKRDSHVASANHSGVPELSSNPCQEDGCLQILAFAIKNNQTQVQAESEHIFYPLLRKRHG